MTVTESLSTEDAAFIREIVAVNEGRAALYRVLAHYYFKELTAEEIEKVASQDFAGMDGGEALIAEGFADMKRYLEKRNTGTRQALAVDYAHTFLAAGNYESFAATPYESVFTSELGLLMQEARDEVYKCYCEEGIQPDESLRTPEDHLSFELEFIACLLDRTNEALRRCDGDAALAYAEKNRFIPSRPSAELGGCALRRDYRRGRDAILSRRVQSHPRVRSYGNGRHCRRSAGVERAEGSLLPGSVGNMQQKKLPARTTTRGSAGKCCLAKRRYHACRARGLQHCVRKGKPWA